MSRRKESLLAPRVVFRILICCVLLGAPCLLSRAAEKSKVDAVRLNNLGVALMNQQLQEKAAAKFDEAFHADPSLATAEINKGIALLYLEKLQEAQEALEHAGTLEPGNPRVWYNLGLVRRSQAKSAEGIEDLQKVLQKDASDPDTHYFLGSFYLQTQDYAKAVQEYEAALKLNALHASAEFGLARALQREGKVDASKEHFQRYQHLTREKIAQAMTNTYGEQGKYSLVQDVRLPGQKVGPMIPVTLLQKPIGAAGTANSGLAKGAGELGGGACLIDLDGDGKLDLVVMGEGEHAIRAYHNAGDDTFQLIPEQSSGLVLSGKAVACAVGDFDADEKPDLAIAMSDRVVLFRNTGGGKFEDVTKAAGIESLNQPAGLTFVDFDHDGDLDLLVTGKPSTHSDGKTSGPSVLWRNNGNSTFTEWTEPSGLAGEGNTVGAVLSDINNDRAVDLVVSGSEGAPTFFANPREGHFKASPLYDDKSLGSSTGLAILDFNKDGWMDVAVTHAGAPGISLWRNVDGKSFERVPLPITDAVRGWGVTPVDIDNDGWIDLAVVIETAKGPELRVLRNKGPDGFEEVSASLGLDKIKLQDPRSVLATDADGHGASDLIVTQIGRDPVLLRNEGGNRNHSLRISLTGLADNKTAIGTKVEVFANGLWQKFEVPGASGYLGQGSPEILAGLAENTHADIVRMLWPTGVPQDEIDVAAVKAISYKELDRRGSSCPVLFAWDGNKYQFVTDVIGAAVVGHWVSPTAKNTPDPDEWIKVEGSQLKERNGYLSLRFGEPMEEVNYVDQVRLVAVDHPEGTEVYPNERFLSELPFAPEKTIVSAAARPPAGAWDNNGQDVLGLLRVRDHKYVRDFKNLSYAGYANMHTLTLDLGAWSETNPLRLLMDGFIEYFSASSMYAAWQAGQEPVPPYVEAQLADGSWKRVIDDMGFPAGLPRTIVVDLTGKLPKGTRRIRLVTNLQIYWDRVLLDNGPESGATIRQTELPLGAARLVFRGYPKQVDGATPGDLTYHYDEISSTGPFIRQRGNYTRYGDVTPLITKVDNKFAIFGSGEEIDAEFAAATLPALPAHWKRDYFFYANGYVKDMDFYEALPFTVADMPFHGMSAYPYSKSEHYPDDKSAVGYQLNWNDRFDSGSHAQLYRFQYQSKHAEPESPQAGTGAR
jgi:tetratricopeptide (TPR) repeat protein